MLVSLLSPVVVVAADRGGFKAEAEAAVLVVKDGVLPWETIGFAGVARAVAGVDGCELCGVGMFWALAKCELIGPGRMRGFEFVFG